MTNEYSGVLPVYKPKGMTSHDVVSRIRRIYGLKRVGHTGTLDPNAEGVLIVCLGRATRFISFFTSTDKAYRAEIIFGIQTDTDDITGHPITQKKPEVTAEDFKAVLPRFVGIIDQKPPVYSALKKDGVRYYDYARRGIAIDIPSRPTRIDAITVIDEACCFPEKAVIDVVCASGTYVRSLCRDIGAALGTVACMGDLLRAAVGDVDESRCVTLDALEKLTDAQKRAALCPVEAFLKGYPLVHSTARGDHFIKNGAALYPWNVNGTFDNFADGAILAIDDSNGQFIGLGKMVRDVGDDPHVRPVRML